MPGLMNHSLPIAGRAIRFALVGCGRISANHFEALRQHAEPIHVISAGKVVDLPAMRRLAALST